jgi:hypothetical protein
MTRYQDTIWCDGCGIEILWTPYVEQGQEFCCEDCAHGLVCDCQMQMEWDDEYRDSAGLVDILR